MSENMHPSPMIPTDAADGTFILCFCLTVFAAVPIDMIDAVATLLLHIAQIAAAGSTLYIAYKTSKNKSK